MASNITAGNFSQNKNLAIALGNNSATTLTLVLASVNQGAWAGTPPKNGSTYPPANYFYAVNIAANSYDALSGSVKFELASGGFLIAQWTWEPGTPLRVDAYCDSDQVQIDYNTINSQSNSATFQITVTNE
ncbi:hypothetical protein Y71_13525 [Kosakonia radicincitans DSM 16656]|uniref:Uncharacterized protein n=1 Tax=Kosakonia radicincitans TaxID=283686 RepID=A0AAX2EP23_9ENTR|nr:MULTISPECIES: hypothetical protein [Kosakonia]MDP9567047.1 hypothetical protein [Kosakonia oryzae]ARD60889.1 hypothetical protein Y71_13525 [Kosakonia radicincitans DSM 16656]KDE38376.1 hypothetical protein AW40_01810 [Kosakonia radicincitans UMEnt01/12]MDD7998476.1 hypothetical protein [Kosakonia radicincitans]PTA92634.1 hypothetical protein CWM66_00890 [Kosakonia sp. H7A]